MASGSAVEAIDILVPQSCWGRCSCVGVVQPCGASTRPRAGAEDEMGHKELSVLEENPLEEG